MFSNGFAFLIYRSPWWIRVTGVCMKVATIPLKFATEHDIDQQAAYRDIAFKIKQYFHFFVLVRKTLKFFIWIGEPDRYHLGSLACDLFWCQSRVGVSRYRQLISSSNWSSKRAYDINSDPLIGVTQIASFVLTHSIISYNFFGLVGSFKLLVKLVLFLSYC